MHITTRNKFGWQLGRSWIKYKDKGEKQEYGGNIWKIKRRTKCIEKIYRTCDGLNGAQNVNKKKHISSSKTKINKKKEGEQEGNRYRQKKDKNLVKTVNKYKQQNGGQNWGQNRDWAED